MNTRPTANRYGLSGRVPGEGVKRAAGFKKNVVGFFIGFGSFSRRLIGGDDEILRDWVDVLLSFSHILMLDVRIAHRY
jgi:hypothetical protein